MEENEPASTDLLAPLIPMGGPTVLFGESMAGKSFLAARICMAVAGGPPIPGMTVGRTGPVLYVDYRDRPAVFRQRMSRMLAGAGRVGPAALDLPISYWHAQGVPLLAEMEAIRRKVEGDGVVLVVIDPGSDACGGSPEEPAVAAQYFNVLDCLPPHVATLTLMDAFPGTLRRPFGSLYWQARPRRVWAVWRAADDLPSRIHFRLVCTKSSDTPRPIDLPLYSFTFSDPTGPIAFEVEAKGEVEDA